MPQSFSSDILPLKNEEIQPAIDYLLKTREFNSTLGYLFPDMEKKKVVEMLKSIRSTDEFQTRITAKAVDFIMERSMDKCTVSGIENINKDMFYLFISNHRDIVLDSGIFNYHIQKEGFTTTEMAIGDNLVTSKWLALVFALNKSFTVKRSVPLSLVLEYSLDLSRYIREAITLKRSSVWLAQREGRAKDGNDATQGGLLKMLSISDEDLNFMDNFGALNIVPLSISYEFDPTDNLKIPQLLAIEQGTKYIKKKNEDIKSIIAGISGYKGNVHLSIGKMISKKQLEPISKIQRKNERLKELAQLIDEQIILNYKLWATNFIAYDLMNNTNRFADKYTPLEKKQFIIYMRKQISPLIGKTKVLTRLFLQQYANPVNNQLLLGKEL
jgi:hypothetical protein